MVAETPGGADCMTVLEGFDALRLFLELTWRRHGLPADAIAFIVGGARFADGAPIDPVMWQDWVSSVQAASRATSGGAGTGCGRDDSVHGDRKEP